MKSLSNFLLGAIIGGLFGATIGLLLAPSSGEELRENMQAQAQRIRNEVERLPTNGVQAEAQLAALRAPHPRVVLTDWLH
jgi:gas vesicle protein